MEAQHLVRVRLAKCMKTPAMLIHAQYDLEGLTLAEILLLEILLMHGRRKIHIRLY